MSKNTKAEAILDNHISKMLNRLPDSYNSISDMKKLPEYQCTIDAMVEYAEQQSDIIHNLFNKPAEKLKPLEDLWRKENSPDRYVTPDRTKFYEWIAAKMLSTSKLTDIEFIKWYSGMEETKIISAYERYMSEK